MNNHEENVKEAVLAVFLTDILQIADLQATSRLPIKCLIGADADTNQSPGFLISDYEISHRKYKLLDNQLLDLLPPARPVRFFL